MFKKILTFGIASGLIVGIILFTVTVSLTDHLPLAYGMVVGYLTMLVALSMVFVGIKRYRDVDLGGVIRFWPAFGMGVGISFIAGIFYVTAWEAAVAVSGMDFANAYAKIVIDEQVAKGVSGEALTKLTAELDQFKVDYANPMFRLPMVFTEIFPVGILVSLISAALLRNRRFLAQKRAA